MEVNQSLQIIDEMVQRARFNFSKGSVFFILWGILLTIAGVGEFLLQQMDYSMPWILWPIAGSLGGIISGIYGSKLSRESSRSYLEKTYSNLWIIYFFTLIVLLVALVSQKINPGPYILIVTGLPTYFTGSILKLKELRYGGGVFWILGLISIFSSPEYSSLIFALAIVLGYLVPGMIMKNRKD